MYAKLLCVQRAFLVIGAAFLAVAGFAGLTTERSPLVVAQDAEHVLGGVPADMPVPVTFHLKNLADHAVQVVGCSTC